MAEKLTIKLIKTLSYNAENGERDVRWDSEMPGFGIRLYPSGKKAFVLSYRQNGTKRLFTIGQFGKVTLEQAQLVATKKLGEVADGQDPLLKRRASRKKHEWNVKRAFGEFLKKYAKPNIRTWKELERIFKKDILPPLQSKPIDEVTKDDILKILDKVLERKSGIMANKTLAMMSSFFNWCVQQNYIKYSPAYQVKAPARKQTRDRVLADYEIKEIWQAADKTNYPFGPLVKMLILTGQRRGEVAAMKWEEFDKEKAVWNLPREKTKSDRAHAVYLTPMAMAVLKDALKMGDHVFSNALDNPFENFSRAKKIFDTRLKNERKKLGHMPMPAWTLHDIRRTVATGMARLGVSPHIVERVLNHSSGTIRGVAAIYNRYEYEAEMKTALEKWEEHIEKVLQTDYSGSYISIPKKTGIKSAA